MYSVNILILALFLIVLTGCSALNAEGEAKTQVALPVVTACIDSEPQKPDFSDKAEMSAKPRVERLKALLSDYMQARAYILELEAHLKACL